MSDAALLAAYRATTWSVEAAGARLTVRPGETAPPALRPAAIVTAWNPASQPCSAAANRRADLALRGRIDALSLEARRTLAHGTGDDAAAWDEPGWCIPGEVRDAAVALGAEFGQNAIVWLDAAGTVSIVCTREGFLGARVGAAVG